MIETLVHLLVVLLVLVIIFAILRLAAAQFGIPAAWVQIIGYILGLIFLIYVLSALGIFGSPGRWRTP